MSENDEIQLAEYLKIMEKWGFGLSRSEVLDAVQQFVTETNIQTIFTDLQILQKPKLLEYVENLQPEGGSDKENITCMGAVSADGQTATPLIIFKGVNLWSSWIPDEEIIPGMTYAASPKGWISSDIFYNYLEKSLIPALGTERPCLLAYDGHVTSKVIELASRIILQC